MKNYAAFHHEDGHKPDVVVTDSAGKETGIRITGYLTTWDEVNGDGQSWKSTAYDENVRGYFEGNGLNIPLDVMHVRDLNHLVGVVESCEKDDRGLLITAFVSSSAINYDSVKGLMDCGALQGFSNYGYLTDYDYEGNSLVVKSFTLISASLVDVPADTGGKFIENSTEWKGFTDVEEKSQGAAPTNIYGISF